MCAHIYGILLYVKWNATQSRKNEIMACAAICMDLETTTLSEARQRKAIFVWYHLYMESKKMIQMNLSTKEKESQIYKTNLWLPKGKGDQRDYLGV